MRSKWSAGLVSLSWVMARPAAARSGSRFTSSLIRRSCFSASSSWRNSRRFLKALKRRAPVDHEPERVVTVTKVGQLLQSTPLTRAACRRDPPARQGSQHAERGGTQMKAVVMREFGGPEVLHYTEIESRKVGPGDGPLADRAGLVNRTPDVDV